eukprot:gene31089-38421_t
MRSSSDQVERDTARTTLRTKSWHLLVSGEALEQTKRTTAALTWFGIALACYLGYLIVAFILVVCIHGRYNRYKRRQADHQHVVAANHGSDGDVELAELDIGVDMDVSERNPTVKVELPTEPPFVNEKAWRFGVDTELADRKLVLIDGEKILETWTYLLDSMTFDGTCLSIMTFGLYWLLFSVLNRTRIRHTVVVTNLRVIFMEEKFVSRVICSSVQRLTETQMSHKLSSLSYILSEEIDALCGAVPATAVMELHFSTYPSLFELPESAYQSSMKMLLVALAKAIKFAYKVDYKAPPQKRILQMMRAQQSSIYNAFKFGIVFVLYGLLEITKALLKSIKLANKYKKSPSKFRTQVGVVHDPQCRENMRRIVQTIMDLLPNSSVTSRAANHKCSTSATPCNINCGDQYHERGGFVIIAGLLKLSPTETVFDVCPNNPRVNWIDIYNTIFTCGVYYFMSVLPKIAYSASYMVTSKRIVKHSVLLSSVGSSVKHSRLDMWIIDPVPGDFVLFQ